MSNIVLFDQPRKPRPWWMAAGIVPVAAYQAKGAGIPNIAATYVNLANPGTFNAAPGVAPTWAAATGWGFNGTTQYLTTGITPTNNQTWSIFIQYGNTTRIGNFDTLVGLSNGAQFFLLQPYRNNTDVRYGTGGLLAVAPIQSSGNIGLSGTQGYRNGLADGGAIGAIAGAFGFALFIGALNSLGAAGSFFKGDIYSMVVFSSTLSSSQSLAQVSAMAAL